MTQAQWIVLAGKVTLISALVSIAAWVAAYTRWAKWWRNPIGRALVIKSVLLALLLLPTTLSMFFSLPPLVMAWVTVALIALITPVMAYRTWVWWRLHKTQGLPSDLYRRDERDTSLTPST